MARHKDRYKGFDYIVDTIDAGAGRYGYQAVVDGKRPLIGIPCGSDAAAMAAGIEAAKAKIDEILQGHMNRR